MKRSTVRTSLTSPLMPEASHCGVTLQIVAAVASHARDGRIERQRAPTVNLILRSVARRKRRAEFILIRTFVISRNSVTLYCFQLCATRLLECPQLDGFDRHRGRLPHVGRTARATTRTPHVCGRRWCAAQRRCLSLYPEMRSIYSEQRSCQCERGQGEGCCMGGVEM